MTEVFFPAIPAIAVLIFAGSIGSLFNNIDAGLAVGSGAILIGILVNIKEIRP